MSEEKTGNNQEVAVPAEGKLTPEEQIGLLKRQLEEAELTATDKNIALIEMTAARNALYHSLQETQMRLAETIGQRENDVEAYQKELDMRLKEKRELEEKYDGIVIKAKRYDELQESLVKIKMDAEIRAHGVMDEAQEKAMDTIMLIDDIEKEIRLFREDLIFLRRDIRIGTFTLDDRLDNIYLRLCKNLDKLSRIKEEFYIRNELPLDLYEASVNKGDAPHIFYPDEQEEPQENQTMGDAPHIHYPDERKPDLQETESEKPEDQETESEAE